MQSNILYFIGLGHSSNNILLLTHVSTAYLAISDLVNTDIEGPELIHYGMRNESSSLLTLSWLLLGYMFLGYLKAQTNVLQISYCVLLVLINYSSYYATNLYPPSFEYMVLNDPQEIEDRVFGSKLVVGLEQCMLFTIWGVKICVWSYLRRLVLVPLP